MTSLDQYRGYTVVGMLIVNFLGGLSVCPGLLEHSNTYISYADTIMPQFFFAVGFAMRLSFTKRLARDGALSAYGRMIRRLCGLILISLVVYTVGSRVSDWQTLAWAGFWQTIKAPLKQTWFQALTHIAVTSLWVLPVIHRSGKVRVLWGIGSAAAHVALSYWFNFEWVHQSPRAIDGGPLGFLTWTIPTLVGSLAYDWLADAGVGTKERNRALRYSAAAAFLLMTIGYLMSCGTRFYDVPSQPSLSKESEGSIVNPVIPARQQILNKLNDCDSIFDILAEAPFVPPPDAEVRQPNYWMMSQRAGSVSYQIFAAGFALLVFGLFYIICDIKHWRNPFFETFGTNALLAYIIHMSVDAAIKPFLPKDSPAWYVGMWLFFYFLVVWLFLKGLEKQGAMIRA